MPNPPTVRPRLTDRALLLDRPDGELQIGLGPQAVCLPDADGSWRTLFSGCHGRATLTRLLHRSGVAEAVAVPVLAELARRGLLELLTGRPVGRPTAGPRVSLVGAGELGAALALGLATADLAAVYVVDQSTPDAATYPLSTARRRSEALCARLDQPLFRPAKLPDGPGGSGVSIVVVAADTVEVDRTLTDRLVRSDQTHLLVRPLPDGAIVGPLVVPGRTACLRCCDLTQRDADPHWPQLLRQLVHTPAVPRPRLRNWAAGLVAVQIAGHLAGQSVDTLGGTVEVDGDDPRQRWRPWSPHPECGCCW